ncbi:MAG: hypothetical protein ACLF0G_16320 [Candidatus Brocadiia bacterium]
MGERHCIHHPDRPAAGLCHHCHRPICEECRYEAPSEGLFCSQECYDRHLAYRSRRQPVIRRGRLKSFLVGLVLLAGLAAAVVFGGARLGVPALESLRDALLGR